MFQDGTWNIDVPCSKDLCSIYVPSEWNIDGTWDIYVPFTAYVPTTLDPPLKSLYITDLGCLFN